MKILNMGCCHKYNQNFFIDRPEGTAYWLLLIVKTPVVFVVDKKNMSFFENTFMLYSPNQSQCYYANSGAYCNDWIEFLLSDEEISQLNDFNIPINMPVSIPNVNVISSLTLNICNEFFSENPHKSLSINLYFQLLLCKLSEMILYNRATLSNPRAVQILPELTRAGSDSRYYNQLLYIRSEIYRWPGNEWHIEDMAKELSVSSSYFQHLYSKVFGISINKDVITSRIIKAAELLRNTDLPVNKIT